MHLQLLKPSIRNGVKNNKRSLRLYGITGKIFKPTENPLTFSDAEVIAGCKEVLGLAEEDCKTKLDAPDWSKTTAIFYPAKLGTDCQYPNTFLLDFAGDRWLEDKLTLWILKRRSLGINSHIKPMDQISNIVL
jgi:hypothetical protein